jgi:cell division protein FtsA
MAGCEIGSVFAGVAGTHIQSQNSHGVIAVKSREVSKSDVERVLDAARAVALPFDRQILHSIPQEFGVDDQGGIQDPVGMSGVRLEAKVHIVTGGTSALENLERCCQRAGLTVQEMVLESLASAEAVLDPNEKQLGVALIDIGGGTTDIAIFIDNSIRYTSVVGLGGNHITSDISVALRCSMDEAEKIKKKYGCALKEMVNDEDFIEVGSVGDQKPRQLAGSVLAEIIEARVEEILIIADRELVRSDLVDSLNAGVVLTGGVALLSGIKELAQEVFDMRVRVGVPGRFGGLGEMLQNPMYATSAGLIQTGKKRIHRGEAPRERRGNRLGRAWRSVTRWFQGY